MVSLFIPVEDTLIIEGDRNSVPILGFLCRLAASFNKVKNYRTLRVLGRAENARPF